jgi:UV DNA damage endonuclease
VNATARVKTVLLPPIWTGHADFTNPFEFSTFMRTAEGLEFDVMMEGKAKDISLLKLRPDLLRFAPEVAARFGICSSEAEELERQEKELEKGVSAESDPDVDEGLMMPLPAEAAE